MNKILLIFMLSLAATKGLAINYYNKSSGASNLQTLSNWGTNTDGTGTAPTDFTTAGNVFYIRNGATTTIGADWTVSGTGSKVVLGGATIANRSFTIPNGINLIGTIDVAASSGTGNTLNITSFYPPTIGTLHSTSTVVYNNSTSQIIAAGNYGNLTIAGGNRNAGNIDFPSGVVDISGTFTFSATFGIGRMYHNNGTIILSGTGAQTVPTVSANGEDKLRYYNLTISGARGANSVTLSTNTSIYIENQFNYSATYTTGGLITTGSTVDYYGNGAQTITALNYNNLTISNSRTTNSITLANGGTIGIAGTFTNSASFTTGNYINTNNTINYNGTGSQTIIPFYYNNLTTSNARTGSNNITLSSSDVIYVANTFSPSATFASGGYVNTNSTVNFNGNSSQTIPAFTYNDIIISGTRSAAQLTLASGNINIQGDASLTATGITSWVNTGNTVNYSGTTSQIIGAWEYNNLTASSNKAGGYMVFEDDKTTKIAGNFTSTATNNTWGAGTSTIEFNGTAAQSIANVDLRYNNLTINNTSSSAAVDFATTDVSGTDNQRFIDGTLSLAKGRLDIEKVQLLINGDIASGGTGSLKGAATSAASSPLTEIYIEGDGALSGSLRMDQTTPGSTNFVTNFIFNRSGTATCTLGSDFGILNFCNIGCDNGGITISSDGRINTVDINGNTLTLAGANHPTSGTYPNYKFRGSASSKLVFMHNANYTGNTRFYMDQTTPGTTNRLQSISIDRRNSNFGIFLAPNGAYGNPVIVSDITFAGTSTSFLCFNSNELTVEGNITGMNASNYFRSRNSNSGGLSRLNIAGSGALSSSLFFDQTAVTLGRDVLVGTGSTDDLTTLTTTAADSCNNFNRLTINRSGQTITLGNKLAISGKVVPTAGTLASAGNLVMLSSNTITSNIDKITSGTSAITGDVVVQSFFLGGTGSSPRGFRMISFPVQDKSSPNNLVKVMQNRFIITGTGGTTNGFDAGGTKQPFAVTLMSYNESASTNAASYNYFPGISSAVSQGLGYFFFFRGNRSNRTTTKVNDTNGVFANPESWTATYTGTINSGDISQAVTLTNNSGDNYNGYNLLGNPYPCTIDFELLRADNTSTLGAAAANGTLCILRRDRLGYITRSGGVSNNTAYPGSTSTGSGTEIRYIQPGQGFMVKAVASGTVTFKESHKVPDQAPARMLSTPVKDGGIKLNGKAIGNNSYTLNEVEAPRQLLRISIEKGEKYEQATLVLEPGNEDKYAGADAIYFGGNDVMLNTLTSDNINTCINFLPEINKVDSVKLFVNSVSNLDSVKLNFTELTALGNDYAILLKDNYLQKETRIGEGVNEYYFSIDKANTGTFGNSRFVMVFVPKSVLSVKIKSFTAKKNSNVVDLNWVTINEESNKRFDIERSIDGAQFVKIGEKVGAGNSTTELSYNFTDKEPVNGNNYYRIKSVDVNNKASYTDIRVVNFSLSNDEAVVSFYPNPVINEFNASWNFNIKETFTIKIVDLNGRVIETFNTVSNKLKHNVSSYAKGVYFIEIVGNKGTLSKTKFVKN